MSETFTQPTSASFSLNQEVAEAIKGSGETIKQAVKSKFVQEEVNRRADLLARLLVAINTFRKEGFKFKPDVIAYNADKTVAHEHWSKAQLDKKQKFEEKLAKAEKSFELALNKNEYDEIENIINQLKPEPKSSDGQKNSGGTKTYSESEVEPVRQ